MIAPGTDLAHALEPLVRRLRWQRRTEDLLHVSASGAIGAAIGLLAVRLGEAPTTEIVTGLGVTLGAIAIAVRWLHHRRDPVTTLAAARRAERDPVWRERLSTAVEYGSGTGVVPRALLADAVAVVQNLDVVNTAPWRWPRRGLVAVTLGATCIAFLAALPTRLVPTIGPASSVEHRTSPTAAAVADLARDVALDARASRDAYLAALAQQLQDLADSADTRPLDAAAQAALDDVLDALAAASGGSISTEQLRADLAARDAAFQADPSRESGASTVADASSSDPSGGASRTGVPDAPGAFSHVEGGTEVPHPEASVGGGTQSAQPGEGEFDPALLDQVRAATPSNAPPPVGAAGELIGAAQEAGAGDSRLAGRGSEALEGTGETVDSSIAVAEAVALTGTERQEGRRIEIELPPAERWDGYDPTLFVVGAWRETPEAPVATDPTPLRYREAAGRYFLPSQETAASR